MFGTGRGGGPIHIATNAIACAALLVIALSGCQTAVDPASDADLEPAARATHIATTGCGLAADRTGSGIAVGDGLVLTVAHLVAQADDLSLTVGEVGPAAAAVVAIDRRRDLALLRLEPNGIPDVELANEVAAGTEGRIVASASGTIDFTVADVVRIEIEEVLGTARHRRLGYELDVEIATGDSGAGAYDDTGRLIGVVFARATTPGTAWITSAAEIADFLEAGRRKTSSIACDPDRSRLETLG